MTEERRYGGAGGAPRTATARRGGRRLADAPRRGQREAPPRRGEKRRLWQMGISAVLLLLVVTVKLALPDVMEQYRRQMLQLLGESSDFTAAFSSVGRAVSGGSVGEALTDAYTAVFGPAEIPAEATENTESSTPAPPDETAEGAVIYGPENTPANVCLTQRVLGFAYGDPVEGTVTSGFGYRDHPIQGGQKFHYALDIGAEEGTVIRSFADGTVTVVAEASELGKYLVVAHANGCSTLYAHCSAVTASSGQQVSRGDPIAEVGDTGMTTGPHLHFELMQGGDYLNPIYYVHS